MFSLDSLKKIANDFGGIPENSTTYNDSNFNKNKFIFRFSLRYSWFRHFVYAILCLLHFFAMLVFRNYLSFLPIPGRAGKFFCLQPGAGIQCCLKMWKFWWCAMKIFIYGMVFEPIIIKNNIYSICLYSFLILWNDFRRIKK